MASLGTVIGRGAFSARPAAGTAGSVYFDTTNSKQWRDNGTTWDDVTPSASVSDATTSTVGGVLVDHAPSGSHPVALTTDGTSLPSGMLGAHTWTGNQTAPALIASGLTGATAASRYVGATASGAPVSGTFAIGDFVIDQTGKVYICTGAGTPGTWIAASGTTTLTTASADLSATSASLSSTYADQLTISVVAGTYLVSMAGDFYLFSAPAGWCGLQVTDGTNTLLASEVDIASSSRGIGKSRLVVLGSSATLHLQAASSAGSCKLVATGPQTGNAHATTISAIRVA